MRQTPWGRDTALVAVTGWGQSEDQQRSLAAGFDSHITKPVAPNALEDLLTSIGAGEPLLDAPAPA